MKTSTSKDNSQSIVRISPTNNLTDDELEEHDIKTEENADDYIATSDSDNEIDEDTILSLQKRKEALQNGDYVVQVHIIEARNLKGRGSNAMSDPVVTVDVMNHKQSTDIKTNCINAVWDQVLFFEFKDLDKQEINEGKCKISVFDANTLMRNVLIGSYEFDLATIYFSTKYHEIYKQWVALYDITDHFDGVQGYLRVSVAVLGPNDEQKTRVYKLLDDAEDANENNLLSVLLPPEIEQKPYLLSISLYECKDLCTSDVGFFSDACDPFAIVEFGSIRIKSKVKKGINVDFLCELQIPVMEPLMSSLIKISFYDWNSTKRNDRIASLSFDYNAVKNHIDDAYSHPKWYILYGAPLGYQRGIARSMNLGFIEGTSYRGQVLMSLSIKKQRKRPKTGLVDISITQELKPKIALYVIQCDLYEGSEIHKIKSLMNNQMYVQICIGRYSAESKRINVKDGRCEWFQVISSNISYTRNRDTNSNITTNAAKKISEAVPLLKDYNTNVDNHDYKGNIGPIPMPLDIDQCPDIFIYLCCASNNKRISYVRIPFKQIYEKKWKNGPKWYNLKEDKAIHALNENIFPGSLLMTLNTGKAENLPQNGQHLAESRPFMTMNTENMDNNMNDLDNINNTNNNMGTLTMYILQAQNLPPMDKNGKSDPYVELKIYDKSGNLCSAKTDTVFESLNPKWYQSFTFNNIDIGETLNIKLFDADKLRTDDLMGFVQILLISQSNRAPGMNFDCKNWFFVNEKYPDSKIQCRLKFEFSVATSEMSPRSTRRLSPCADFRVFGQPTKKSMQLRIHLYQARNLLPQDANGLCDPYVIIRCCGQITKSKIIYETIDPVFYQTLILNVLLPQPLTFAPDIHIHVFDSDKFSKDDVVGGFLVRPNDIISQNLSLSPKWFSLYDIDHIDGSTDKINGEILMSFQLIAVSHHIIPIIPSLVPKSTPKWLQIITLGLRDLNSTFGVNKPYLKFTLNDKTFKTKHSNKPSSQNPNFLQILKIKISLPNDDIFAPSLRLTVKDSLFGGTIKRTIGNASISLQDLLQNKNENENENESRSEFKIETAETTVYETTADEDEIKININDTEERESFDFHLETKETGEEVPKYMIDREIIDNELEDEIKMNPFLEIPIFTGCGQRQRRIGFFKGLMEITNSNKSSELRDKINVGSLLKPKNLFIRLYILRGIRLTPKDYDGSCDPYLVIKGVGFGKNHKISTRSRYIKNTLDPEFYESFEIPVQIPGASKLSIEVWDYDGIGDDLVGKTVIDIEDRWFSESWQALGGPKKIKPLEIRTLHSNASSFPQGKLELWLEILTDIDIKYQPLLDISPPPPSPYELRVIIWECKNVTIKDEMSQMNDLFVTCALDGVDNKKYKKQQTDLHFRSQRGFGSFNWRMKFQLDLPCKQPPRLRIQIWDKDFFSVNDSICEAYLDLSGLFKKSLKNHDRTVMKCNGKERFWIDDLRHPNFDGNQGEIKISIECMPMSIAQQLPAGYGQSDPNMNPYLAPPEGRSKFSLLSPLRSLRNLLGDKIVCKLCIGFVISAITSFLLLLGPTLASILMAKAMGAI